MGYKAKLNNRKQSREGWGQADLGEARVKVGVGLNVIKMLFVSIYEILKELIKKFF